MADNAFEKLIEKSNKYYRSKGIARIDRIHPPSFYVGTKLRKGGKSTVDYCGCYNGHFIAFDAKDCARDRIGIDQFKKHQVEYIQEIERFGGIGFFIVRMIQHNRIWTLRITDEWLKAHWNKDRRPAMREVDFDKFGDEVDDCNSHINYLSNVYKYIIERSKP